MQQLELFNTTSEQMNTKSSQQKDYTKNLRTFSIQHDTEFIVDGESEVIGKGLYRINLKYYDKISGSMIDSIELFLERKALEELINKLQLIYFYQKEKV